MNRRQRRRIAQIRAGLIATPFVLLVAAYLVGMTLSPVQTRRAELAVGTSAETVWAVLIDVDGMLSWRHDLAGIQRLPAANGVVRWRETTRGGANVAVERVEVEAPRRLVVQVAGTGAPVRWIYQIASVSPGSRVTVTEERTIRNPLQRPFVQFLGVGHGPIDRVARDLAYRLDGYRQVSAGLATVGTGSLK